MKVRFSVIANQYDAHPVVHECEWHELVQGMSAYDFREAKEWGALVSPAEFFPDQTSALCTCKTCKRESGDERDGPGLPGKIRKRKTCVGPVSFLALDFDDVSPDAVLVVLNLVDSLNLSAFAYSTWKQPIAAQSGLARVRLFILISRRVQPEEWATFYRASVARFNASMADDTADEPTRFYFTPSLPLGAESHAQFWTSKGYTNGDGVPFDVDEVMRNAPKPDHSASPTIVSKGTDPIPRDALLRLATKLEKADDHQKLRVGQLLRTGLNGHEIALQGDRHVALRDMAWRIAIAFPSGSAVTIAEHFRLSLDFMRETADQDPVAHFCGLIESAQAKVQAQAQEVERQTLSQQARKTAIAWQSVGMQRTSPYTQAELAEWARPENGGPLDSRWILQVGSAIWIWFAGDYIGPFMREAIGPACAQWLAPALSAGVDVFKMAPNGERVLKQLHELVGSYGRVLQHVEADMSATRTHFDDRRSAIVEAPCPVRTDLEPTYDPEIDEWLRLLAGHKYERLCDWLATCTRLRECSPAVFFKGASGAGKDLFASGVARLWTENGFTPADVALGQFNAAIVECPLVYANERVPENWKGEPRTEELRALITTTSFKLNQKNRPIVTCHGSARVVIGANNFGIISRKADFTPEDAQALADRFILIDVGTLEHCPARDYLISKGGAAWGDLVVAGDRLAKHALWLRDEVESGRRPFTRGGRMIVAGDAAELITALQTGSRVPWYVMSWVWSFLREPSVHIAASAGRPLAVLVFEGKIWLEPGLLLRAWEHYLAGERPPTLEQISKAARGMLHTEREGRLRRGAGGKHVYRMLRLEQLQAWADTNERDASELEAMLAIDTESIGVPGVKVSGSN